MSLAFIRGKGGGNMKTFIFSIVFLVAGSASAEGLYDAISSALQEAGKDHSATQVALEVSPEQVETAKFKRDQNPMVVEVNGTSSLDKANFATSHLADEIEVEDTEDNIMEELSDNVE
jgi:hypothetical protein